MKCIYFGYLDAYGHTCTTVPVLRELIKSGVTMLSFSDIKFKEKFVNIGSDFLSYPDYNGSMSTKKEYPDFFKRWYESLTASVIMRKFIYNEICLSVIKYNPDFIVFDRAALWGQDIADNMHIPGICISTGYNINEKMLDEYRAIIRNGYLGMDGMTEDEQEQEIQKLNRSLLINHRKFNCKEKCLNDFLIFKGDFKIILYLKEFQMCSNYFEDTHHFVGPPLYNVINNNLEYSIANFIKSKKCIYVSLGSDHPDNLEFYKKIINYSVNNKNLFVISAGNRKQEMALWNYVKTANIYITPFAPQHQVLKNACLFITHGGTSSVMQAIHYQVPMLVVPQAIDEFLIAEMIDELEVGINVLDDRFKTMEYSELDQIISELINRSDFKENLKHFHDLSISRGGEIVAAELILDHLKAYK
jgi:MGT family glycosyltransferase